ncbi:MAG: FlgD immunoglobulin-like domain containing protein, partial [bacterium]
FLLDETPVDGGLQAHQQMVFRDQPVVDLSVKGELVKLLPISVQGAGIYEVKWDGVTQKGLLAAGGVYIYTVDFGDAILASTMTYLK